MYLYLSAVYTQKSTILTKFKLLTTEKLRLFMKFDEWFDSLILHFLKEAVNVRIGNFINH